MKTVVMTTLLFIAGVVISATPLHAYLDPGTGSFVFQMLIASLLGALFTVKIFWQRLKNFFSGKRDLIDKRNEKN